MAVSYGAKLQTHCSVLIFLMHGSFETKTAPGGGSYVVEVRETHNSSRKVGQNQPLTGVFLPQVGPISFAQMTTCTCGSRSSKMKRVAVHEPFLSSNVWITVVNCSDRS